MKTNVVLFDKDSQERLLGVMGKSRDSQNFLVEKDNPSQRVLTKKGEEVKFNEFAGVKSGSEEFIKNDINSILDLADSLE